MVGADCLEKLLDVISRLQRLIVEVMLDRGDMFFVKVIDFLVIVVHVSVSSNCDPLGVPLWPLLFVFHAPLHALADSLGQCPSATSGGCHPIVVDEHGPNCLLIEGVLGGDVRRSFAVFG
jgi:hypothetical protein